MIVIENYELNIVINLYIIKMTLGIKVGKGQFKWFKRQSISSVRNIIGDIYEYV